MSLADELAQVVRDAVRAELERLPANSAPTIDPLEMLTPDDVAKLFKLQPDTIRSYCDAGKLPARRFGNVWRIRRAELLEHLERHGLPEGTPSTTQETDRILRSLRAAK